MEKDDQLIRELLKEGFYTKAPDGFTEYVMKGIAKESKPVRDISPLAYAGMLFSAFASFGVILYLLNYAFVESTARYFMHIATGLFAPLVNLLNGFQSMDFSFSFNGMFVGILAVIAVLLALDRFYTDRKSLTGSLFI